MSEDIRIDSHKLMYHPQRVADYLAGKMIYPIEVEIGLSSMCNHRCIFCAVDYMEYKPVLLDASCLLKNLQIMKMHGLKSIIYAGEGEPLLNPEASYIINQSKSFGLDCAMSTNGVLMTEEFSRDTLASLTWVRFSIAGGTEVTYKKIHRCKDGDLEKVLLNMQKAVEIKRKHHLNTTLGAQLLLLPENKDDIIELAKRFKEIGLDYFTIKPFSQHPLSKARIQVDYDEMLSMENELKAHETEDYKVYFRRIAIENLRCEKKYDRCRGLNFMTYIDALGGVYPCIVFMGDEQLHYGNLHESSFDQIWETNRARGIRAEFEGQMLHNRCRQACRLDEINKYLEELEKPQGHVNFI